MSLFSTPSFELVLDDDVPFRSPSPPPKSDLDLAAESAFQALLTNEPIEAINDAFFGLVLKMPVPHDIDASTFDIGTRLALESITPEGKYLLPEDHLMGYDDPHNLERSWAIRPIPTTPYGMGLSFETSGWRAPAYRSPECREIESRCIDPALLLGGALGSPEPQLQSPSHATTLVAPVDDIPQTDYSMSFDLETPEAVPVDVDMTEAISDDEVEEKEQEVEEDDEDDTADSDLEEVPTRTRPIRSLPRRAALKGAVALPPAPRSSRASAPISKQSASTKKSSPAKKKSSRRASAFTVGKKRKAASAAARKAGVARRTAATATAAATTPATASTSFELPHIPGVNDPGLPAPPNSGTASAMYWPLLRLGSHVVPGGVKCNINGCGHKTNSWGDMGRHVPAAHFRTAEGQFKCAACPWTFARRDALERHEKRKRLGRDHFTAERIAFLPEFNAMTDVVALKNNCAPNSDAIRALNKDLDVMFEKKLAEHRKAKASA
ncbi:hypothetical protein C8R45DRAFT_1223648 [Mycena sanguinolenta]|nr:hypothetical protein C8R45DRAFT_1223648 [Mycena sanguinolenta]